jgi:hypothetical protein
VAALDEEDSLVEILHDHVGVRERLNIGFCQDFLLVFIHRDE